MTLFFTSEVLSSQSSAVCSSADQWGVMTRDQGGAVSVAGEGRGEGASVAKSTSQVMRSSRGGRWRRGG